MPLLVAAVALVGVIASVNLLLSYGIIRRLREHESKLAGYAGEVGTGLMLAVGTSPTDFEPVVSTTGDTITRESLKGSHITFFSPKCKACKEETPKLLKLARQLRREDVLVVAAGSPEETLDLVATFEPVARVVVEPDRGPIQLAFEVDSLPSLAVLDDQTRVVKTAFSVDALFRA